MNRMSLLTHTVYCNLSHLQFYLYCTSIYSYASSWRTDDRM